MEENPHFPWPPSLLFFIIAATLLPISHSQQQSPSYLNFVSNATDFPAEDYFDYVIVGGGTAGCPLAATLSERFKVLVLERGGIPFGNPNLMTREGFLTTLTETDAYESPAQSFTSEDGVPNARGRVLGGSSAINAGFYSRADQEFYARSGINWDLRTVNQSYQWIEKAIVFRPQLKNWQSAVRDALIEAGIDPYNGFSLDHLAGTKIGGSTFDSAGRRHSAADLLSYGSHKNIKVVVHASVERILVASSSPNPDRKQNAIGAVFRDHFGGYHHAMVKEKGEVFLCAGALGSPQLLLLSGVGPRPYLASWGIPVVYHQPYVGRFVYDNPRNGISIVPPVPLDHSLIQVVGVTAAGTYLEAASNIVPFASPARPVFVAPPGSSAYLTVATLMEKIVGPVSAGSLRLASTDVRVNPIVRFNYFSNPDDLKLCMNGTRKIGEVLKSRAMEDFKFHHWFGSRDFRYVGPPLPADLSDDAQMSDFCRHTVNTIWHYHGGCLVGKVVDRDLKVIGIDGLRVIDGSTFTVSPGTNPQATVLMLGRFFGLKLLKERRDVAKKKK
ncbi:(R)-mandelonitrile lyase-like [Andrographis paniculata]|uniref:(R)-mandelonitrile lyase-like n=1 Tax=Andrographis paniculata TaxID=175694 RepID=UPI0021E985C5|nr:(R)-mandelonitrile lyase-like [Andrographis paniculata]XP_051116931.1 (R)-mandelonitrile lyase-like [Andrographis paniculata]